MDDQPLGKVIHYYDRLEVAVVTLNRDKLNTGDLIKIKTRDGEFEQVIDSMEINKEKVQTAKPGDDFALKVNQPVREGDQIFKV